MTFVGHRVQESRFLEAFESGRLHHAWLLAGPRSTGKAGFADRIATFLLTDDGDRRQVESLDPPAEAEAGFVMSLLKADTHPERIRLSRLPHKDPTKPAARNITIDQVRALHDRLHLSIGLGRWRVIVIDSIDDLEPVAANAILKILEEPPASTVFLLVSHAPGLLLPTIRSRCRVLRFGAVGADALTQWLHALRPHDDRSALHAVHRMSGGIPGLALEIVTSGAGQSERVLRDIARTGDRDGAMRQRLAQGWTGAANRAAYEAVLRQAPQLYANLARETRSQMIDPADAQADDWQTLRALCAGAIRESSDITMTAFTVGTLFARLSPAASR